MLSVEEILKFQINDTVKVVNKYGDVYSGFLFDVEFLYGTSLSLRRCKIQNFKSKRKKYVYNFKTIHYLEQILSDRVVLVEKTKNCYVVNNALKKREIKEREYEQYLNFRKIYNE